MRMYVIFIIFLQNYEKAVHANNHRFFWKGLCLNYLFQLYRSEAGLFESNLFWVSISYPGVNNLFSVSIQSYFQEVQVKKLKQIFIMLMLTPLVFCSK